MRVTSKGQVTIPQTIRERHGLFPNTVVDFIERGDEVLIVSRAAPDDRGSDAVTRLDGRADTGLSTDEILALTRA